MSQAPTMSDGSLVDALKSSVRGLVRDDLTYRGVYATDASHYQMMPRCVVSPIDADDTAAVIAFAREHNIPITGRGGGTSLAGQTFGTGIVLDFSRHMNQLLEVNTTERWARVQPGIVRDQLNAQLAGDHLFFAPDPATTSRATVGGMIANNSSGMRSILYGRTLESIISLDVLLSDGTRCTFEPTDRQTWQQRATGTDRVAALYRNVGALVHEHADEIEKRFPKVMRRVGGYNLDAFVNSAQGPCPAPDGPPWNLSHLICGSEGTLGVILEAKIQLHPTPKATALCIVHFDELIESLRHVPAMLEHAPAAVELLDQSIIDEASTNPSTRGFAGFFEGKPRAVQIVEFFGDSADEAAQRAAAFATDMQKREIGTTHVLRTEPMGIQEVWELRRLGVGLQSNVKGRRKPLDFVDDACVPVEKLAQYIERLQQVCDRHGVKMPICAHSSVGVLHPKPMLDLHDPDDVQRMEAIANEAFDIVRELGGAWVGEHGDGLVRGQFLKPFFGEQLYSVFGKIKQFFDPAGLMNPGKILDTPPMTSHLRHATPDYEKRIAEVHANYHYRDQDGFAHAVEQCNGVGACRKIDRGTMCPSYMATRDEIDSTRGRANALRLAMSGQLDETGGLTGDGVRDALSLCLQCKACKSECPNAVDMAKMKSDVLQMRHDAHGTPLGYKLIARAPEMARKLAGPLAPMINVVQNTHLFRTVLEKVAGIDARRMPPAYANRTLKKTLSQRKAATPVGTLGTVVLFDDTYASCFEPNVGLAAVALLEGCGYDVQLAQAGCCQRPRLSKGLVREAKKHGEQTLRNVDVYLNKGLPVVCLEPSCFSSLVDDLGDLMTDASLAQRVRSGVLMLDTFLAQEMKKGKLDDVQFRSPVSQVLLHGHCHQKAMDSTQGMKTIFQRIDGLRCEEVDAGCCGMAGSFGYENYDLSMSIANQRLLPAVKAFEPNDDAGRAVCANGFSCRHQLADATGIKAKHWVELVQASRD